MIVIILRCAMTLQDHEDRAEYRHGWGQEDQHTNVEIPDKERII